MPFALSYTVIREQQRLQPYHDPLDEPTAEPLDPSFFDFDYGDPLNKEELKGGKKFIQTDEGLNIHSAHIQRSD
jgi:hypothetical protein